MTKIDGPELQTSKSEVEIRAEIAVRAGLIAAGIRKHRKLSADEVNFLNNITDEVEMLGFVAERHQAVLAGRYGEFLLKYSPIEEAA
jgi:hypothetical protein